MSVIVDARENEAEYTEEQRVLKARLRHVTAARTAAVIDECTEEAENGGRRADGERRAAKKERRVAEVHARQRAEGKPEHARHRIDDDHPRGSVQIGNRGRELTNPQNVEQHV